MIQPTSWEICLQEAHNDLVEWEEGEKSTAEQAALIYEDLYKKNASKAVAAQFMAKILKDKKYNCTQLVERLPAYILEAIEHLTGPGLIPDKNAQ